MNEDTRSNKKSPRERGAERNSKKERERGGPEGFGKTNGGQRHLGAEGLICIDFVPGASYVGICRHMPVYPGICGPVMWMWED